MEELVLSKDIGRDVFMSAIEAQTRRIVEICGI